MHELGLGGPIELARVQARLRLALDCGHQSIHHTCPARPFDRRDPGAELVDDLLIRQTRVRQQQNSRAPGAVGVNPTTADQRFESRAFVVRELDDVALHARLIRPFRALGQVLTHRQPPDGLLASEGEVRPVPRARGPLREEAA